ncbi:MAG: Rrf2 family transcriptional regulator [bacterium]
MAMQITRAGEYAIKSLVYLAEKPLDSRIMASEIATAENIPINFVRKILETLVKGNLVNSFRGAGGGFCLNSPPTEISVRQIMEIIEGPIAINQCLTPESCVNRDICPLNPIWAEAQNAMVAVFERYSLADIAAQRNILLQASTDVPATPA